jgi:hypothetical protein
VLLFTHIQKSGCLFLYKDVVEGPFLSASFMQMRVFSPGNSGIKLAPFTRLGAESGNALSANLTYKRH